MTQSKTLSTGTDTNHHASPRTSVLAAWFQNVLREPLLHFVLLGAGLFGLHACLPDSATPTAQQIVVSAGKIEHLSAIFSKTWQRPPTAEELQGLIDDYILEEVACREGKAMGLDQDDTIIRRRIRQKLDFFAEDLANQTEPSEAELVAFFGSRRELYSTVPQLSFRQIYFDPDRHDASLDRDIKTLIEALTGDSSNASPELGDRSLLEYQHEDVPLTDVVGIFGDEFASKVAGIPVGRWQGPIRSAYGLHVVIVDQRQPGRLVPLDEVREVVRRDWEHRQRQELAENFYRGLLSRYLVTIEWPNTASGEE